MNTNAANIPRAKCWVIYPKHPKVHVFQGPNWCHAGCSFSLVALIYFWSGYNLYSEQDNNLFSTSNHRLLKRNVCNKFIEHGLCARYSARNWSGYKESKALLPRGAYPSGWELSDCHQNGGVLSWHGIRTFPGLLPEFKSSINSLLAPNTSQHSPSLRFYIFWAYLFHACLCHLSLGLQRVKVKKTPLSYIQQSLIHVCAQIFVQRMSQPERKKLQFC